MPPLRHGGVREGSQDKRIRKPKLEKWKERKLKRKEKKRAGGGSRKKKTTRGPGASPFFIFQKNPVPIPLNWLNGTKNYLLVNFRKI